MRWKRVLFQTGVLILKPIVLDTPHEGSRLGLKVHDVHSET